MFFSNLNNFSVRHISKIKYVLNVVLVIVDTKQPPTTNTEMVPQVIVGAISIGIIGVIIVAMVIYMCCFKQKLNPNQRREQLMRKNKGKCSSTLPVQNSVVFYSSYV